MKGYGFEEYLLSYLAYELDIKIIYDPRITLIHHKAPSIEKSNNILIEKRPLGWEMAVRKSDFCLKILPIPFNLIGFLLWKMIQILRWIKEPYSSGLTENLYLDKTNKYKRLSLSLYIKYLNNGGRIF